jgi:hypothetical protein
MEQWFPEDGSNDQDWIVGVVMLMIDLDLYFIVGVLWGLSHNYTLINYFSINR